MCCTATGRCVLVLLGCAVTGLLSASGAESVQSARSESERLFQAEIAPLLARHCLDCHDTRSKQGGLSLARKMEALAGGESGPAVVPGKSGESLLWQYVESDEMPKNRPPLSSPEKRLLRQWIDGGAIWTSETIEAAAFAADRGSAYDGLRRLTASEYIQTVRNAVGMDFEQDARRILPPDQRADGFSNTAYHLQVDLEQVEAYAQLAELIVGRMDVMKFAAEHVPARVLADARSKWPSRSATGAERNGPQEMRGVIGN